MQNCPQTETQSVYQHGLSVKEHIFELINFLKNRNIGPNWKLPEWLFKYQGQILNLLLPLDIIEQYTIFHDCGKPYCLTVDQEGRKHFPNHAEVSYHTWMEVDANITVGKLILMDMTVHTMKAVDVPDFIKHPEAITLLLAALAEIHSNAKMFGGINSTSFKIKWNHIDKRGKAICNKLFGENNGID